MVKESAIHLPTGLSETAAYRGSLRSRFLVFRSCRVILLRGLVMGCQGVPEHHKQSTSTAKVSDHRRDVTSFRLALQQGSAAPPFSSQFPNDDFHALLRVDCALLSGSPILVLGGGQSQNHACTHSSHLGQEGILTHAATTKCGRLFSAGARIQISRSDKACNSRSRSTARGLPPPRAAHSASRTALSIPLRIKPMTSSALKRPFSRQLKMVRRMSSSARTA
jgi:hypothetical protein